MTRLDEEKQSQVRLMLFSVKTLALFFCAAPLFLFFFRENTSAALMNVNLGGIIISLVIIGIITFMWVFMDAQRTRFDLVAGVEITLLFAVCLTSIFFSGGAASDYKFLFIFLIVSYTIEWGARIGMVLAAIASGTLFALDIVAAPTLEAGTINPYLQPDIALAAIFFGIAWVLGFYVRIEAQHIDTLRQYANLDGLTNVYNHRYFQESLRSEIEASRASGRPLGLIMLDIDYFKQYNDSYGHQQGDEVLREVAQLLTSALPQGGIVCRYGGEEFTALAPGLDADATRSLADKMRRLVQDHAFPGEERLPGRMLTISAGYAVLRSDEGAKDLVARADAALYKAKFLRKNRVESYSSIFDQFADLDKGDESLISVKSLITVINSRDSYTYSHVERVVLYSQVFADYVKLSAAQRRVLLYSAYLHDLGKIDIDKETLIADAPLSEAQWQDIRRHPVTSAEMIEIGRAHV